MCVLEVDLIVQGVQVFALIPLLWPELVFPLPNHTCEGVALGRSDGQTCVRF